MMDTLAVRVEQRHIDAGVPRKCTNCPIALALTEQHPPRGLGFSYWHVTELRAIGLSDNVLLVEYLLPEEASSFVHQFDAEDYSIQPFAFTMERIR